MPRERLRQDTIRRFAYRGDGGSRDVRWDSALPGFGVRVYPSGRLAFVLSYRAGRRKRLMTLGDFGTLTLDQARKKARAHLVAVEEGTDPLVEKAKAVGAKTFGELRDAYMDRHAKSRKKTWKQDEARFERHVPAGWAKRAAASIERSEVAELHHKVGREARYEANRLIALLRKVFNLGRVWGFLPESAANPAAGIDPFDEQSRKRWVTPAELRHVAEAIDSQPNVYVRGALWLYLLTGARKSELLAARHDDVDYDQAMLRLPKNKSGDEQAIPLSRPALAIVRALPKVDKNPYLLPGGKKGKPLVNIGKAWLRVRRAATVKTWAASDSKEVAALLGGLRAKLEREPNWAECIAAAQKEKVQLPPALEDARLHDLRRTVGSWLTQAGVDLNTVRDALRHGEIGTTLVYARLGADPARAAMEQHGERIVEIAGRQRVVVAGGDA